ncbi:hypothetical protein SJ05684_c20710 [Sinorhizobium sojae CCBAU 05684]|uniref:Uncharacterized protein n=1 Tax=Sinorhizobium sojae CCBAU 05684 TaxID=716928 RepID=A0A249PCM4_9HYPH|nr:hypothetical protein SJ05684_c20710 [Sinorhizobium sojae CCBAU 05684]
MRSKAARARITRCHCRNSKKPRRRQERRKQGASTATCTGS